jgi:hypothetical protein
MRRLVAGLAGLGLLAAALGCHHTAGMCDCDVISHCGCDHGGPAGYGGCGCGHNGGCNYAGAENGQILHAVAEPVAATPVVTSTPTKLPPATSNTAGPAAATTKVAPSSGLSDLIAK